jgi:hypothetical protein
MTPCPGPLVWFDVEATETELPSAVLECASCSYLIASGSFNDDAHSHTPLLRSVA